MDWSTPTSLSLGIIVLFTVVTAEEICEIDNELRVCEYGCCSVGDEDFCCLSGYAIAGLVFACIAVICAVAAIIFCCVRQKKQAGRVMHVQTAPAHSQVTVINATSNQPHPYGQPFSYNNYPPTQPLPPGYTPTYSSTFNTSGPPPYGVSQPQHAPPPYNLNEPSTSSSNPFTTAAYASEASGNRVSSKK